MTLKNGDAMEAKQRGESTRGEIPIVPPTRLHQYAGDSDYSGGRYPGHSPGMRGASGFERAQKDSGLPPAARTTLSDLMKVYATINQGGLYREPIFIRRVVSRDGLVLEDGSHPMDPTSTGGGVSMLHTVSGQPRSTDHWIQRRHL